MILNIYEAIALLHYNTITLLIYVYAILFFLKLQTYLFNCYIQIYLDIQKYMKEAIQKKNFISLAYVYMLFFCFYDVGSKFINYDDFKMGPGDNIIINGNFSNPYISPSVISIVVSQIQGWKTRTNNFQIGLGKNYNTQWPQNFQVCELVSDRQSIIYQQMLLKESYYLLRFDYSARSVYLGNPISDPQNYDFYVYLNFAQVLYIKPGDQLIRKKQIILKTTSGINVIEFMGMSRVSRATVGAQISNVQLFPLNKDYPNQIEAVALGSTVTDSDHIAQNYLLDFYPVDQIQSWCSKACVAGSWIQISSLSVRSWKSVITQGRGDEDSWITKYKVAYTMDGISWKYAQNDKIFSGNTDKNTKIVNTFSNLLNARALRIIVVDFSGNPCARVGATFIQNEISSTF